VEEVILDNKADRESGSLTTSLLVSLFKAEISESSLSSFSSVSLFDLSSQEAKI
jgi:hypothetical protein